MPDLVCLGLAGVGRWGRNYVRAIEGLPDVVLVAAASRNVETPAIVGTGCKVVRNWQDLIDVDNLDGIIVATPPATHAEIARSAIDKQLAVLIEKPLTMSVGEAYELLNCAQQKSAIAFVDHTHLFSPAFQALRRELQSLGSIDRIDGVAGNMGPFRDDVTVLWDWGAHDVAMCLDLMKEMPVDVRASIINREVVDGHIGETVEIELTFSNGVDALIRIGNIMKEKTRLFTVSCRSGTVVYDDCAAIKTALIDPSGNRRPVACGDAAPLTLAIQTFVNAVRRRRPQIEGLRFGARVIEVLASAEKSVAAWGDLK